MSVLLKVLGLTVAGVTVIALYLAVPVLGQLLGTTSPLNYAVYLGLALTAVFLSLVMYLASSGGSEA
jgi:hypothetical protein